MDCSSSGCESGWTMYLDHSSSSFSKNQYQGFGGNYADDEEEEEVDLSMVSDASSGPPHYCEEDDDSFDQLTTYNNKKKPTKKKNKEYSIPNSRYQQHQHHSFLDDTASSPVLGKKLCKNSIEGSKEHALEFSQGFSATHFKGKSSLKKQFSGFFQFSHAEKSASKEAGGLQGTKWK